VAAQVALAMLVLAAAGVIARSLVALERADLAFDPSRLVIAELSMRTDQYDDVKRQRALIERVVSQVGSVPGVRAVARSSPCHFRARADGTANLRLKPSHRRKPRRIR
jgi:hypothetical protein